MHKRIREKERDRDRNANAKRERRGQSLGKDIIREKF